MGTIWKWWASPTSIAWTDVVDKPTAFTPSTHTHSIYISSLTGDSEISVSGTNNSRTLSIGTIPFSKIGTRPTTLSGYGITDAFDGSYNSLSNRPTLFDGNYNSLSNKPVLFNGSFNSLTNVPTTLAGYGIVDAFNGTWTSLTGKPNFAAIATTGSFNDLNSRPTTISGYGITDAFNGTWSALTGRPTFATVATSGSYNDLSNRPTLFNGAYSSLSGVPTTFTPTAHDHEWLDINNSPFEAYMKYLKYYNDTIITPGSPGSNTDSTYYTLPTYAGTIYYIDPSAPTNGNGSEGNPYNTWAGISFVNNASYLQKRGTTFNSAGSITPGTGLNVSVRLGAYGDTTLARPRIIVSNTDPVIRVTGNNTYLIKDLALQASRYGLGIRHDGAGTTWVYNCDIQGGNHNYWKYGPTTSQGTVKILYSTLYDAWTDNLYSDDIMNLEIGHSHFYDCNIAYFTYPGDDGPNAAPGDNIQLATAFGELNFNIYNTIIDHSSTGHKFGFIAWNGYTPVDNAWNKMNGIFRDNIVIGSRSQGFAGSNGCIYLGDMQAQDTIIFERNIITDGSIGIFCESSNIQSLYNVIHDVGTAISLSQSGGRLKAHNNTFANYTSAGISAISGTAVVSRNNVFSSGSVYAYNTNATYDSDYNYFQGFVANGSTTLASWQGSTTNDDNSQTGDPLFINPSIANYRPNTGSPLLNSGIDLGYLYDVSKDNVTDPPSKGAYENILAPIGGGSDPVPADTVYRDSILAVVDVPFIIGTKDGKHAEFIDGDLYFRNGADLQLNWQNVPIANGTIGQVQFSDGFFLSSSEDLIFKNDSSLLTVPNVRISNLTFADGTSMTTAATSSPFTPGDNNISKYSINANVVLADTITPDYLYIDTDYFTDTSFTLAVPTQYIIESYQVHPKVALTGLSISDDNEELAYITTPVINKTIKGNINASYESDSIYIVASGNTGDGIRALLKFERNYLYVAPVPVGNDYPPFTDGNSTMWLATDTTDYYMLKSSAVEVLYDKLTYLTLGDELMDPVDFTLAAWTKTGTVSGHTANTFTVTAAGGVYRLYQPPAAITRAVYRFNFTGTATAGTVTMYNGNNTTTPLVVMNGGDYYYATANNYMYFRNSAASTTTISTTSWKRVLGNNLVQTTSAARPTIVDGAVSFNGTTQFVRSAATPTISYQKVFIVGRQGAGDYYLYETLTGFGANASGVITIGASGETTPATFYDVDIKEIVFRNEDNSVNDALFRDHLMSKYSVTLAP